MADTIQMTDVDVYVLRMQIKGTLAEITEMRQYVTAAVGVLLANGSMTLSYQQTEIQNGEHATVFDAIQCRDNIPLVDDISGSSQSSVE